MLPPAPHLASPRSPETARLEFLSTGESLLCIDARRGLMASALIGERRQTLSELRNLKEGNVVPIAAVEEGNPSGVGAIRQVYSEYNDVVHGEASGASALVLTMPSIDQSAGRGLIEFLTAALDSEASLEAVCVRIFCSSDHGELQEVLKLIERVNSGVPQAQSEGRALDWELHVDSIPEDTGYLALLLDEYSATLCYRLEAGLTEAGIASIEKLASSGHRVLPTLSVGFLSSNFDELLHCFEVTERSGVRVILSAFDHDGKVDARWESSSNTELLRVVRELGSRIGADVTRSEPWNQMLRSTVTSMTAGGALGLLEINMADGGSSSTLASHRRSLEELSARAKHELVDGPDCGTCGYRLMCPGRNSSAVLSTMNMVGSAHAVKVAWLECELRKDVFESMLVATRDYLKRTSCPTAEPAEVPIFPVRG